LAPVSSSFERAFPWDVAYDFDVLLAGWPTNWSDILLYMPGHLTVFRNDPHVAAEFLVHVPELATYDAFISPPPPGSEERGPLSPYFFASEACEEGAFSHALFIRGTRLTFLRFDAMVESGHHISTLDGVFTIENDGWIEHEPIAGASGPLLTTEEAFVRARVQLNDALTNHSMHMLDKHTFTDKGIESKVNIRNNANGVPFVWFAPEYAVSYTSALGSDVDGNGRSGRRLAFF
jgi:hypothetical protein